MKEWFNEHLKYGKTNWRVLVIKSVLLVLGMFTMALGIAMYIPTGLGKSQVDFAVFTFAYIGLGKFASDNDVLATNYKLVLTLFYVTAMVVAAIFGLAASLRDYKKTKAKAIWITFGTIVITDLIVTFVFPYMVNFFANSWTGDANGGVFGIAPKLIGWFATFDSATSSGVRSWMFVLSFIVFCLGIALWVKSSWAPGSYNSICTQFMALTKLNYTISRILCDIMIVTPAVIAIWFINGDSVANFFTNFSIATIAFVFVAGPLINLMMKYMNKFVNFDKITRTTDQPTVAKKKATK